MSNFLHQPNETFFVDLNILVSTDLFVVDQIYRYLYRTNDTNDIFYNLKQAIELEGVGYGNLHNLLQLKKNRNPLLQYMITPDQDIADQYYNGILIDDNYQSDQYFPNLRKTTIGNALNTLVKDTNFDKVYVYAPKMTEALFTYIMTLFPEKPKWNFVTGDRGRFLAEYECNNYFIEDISTITQLVTKRHIIEGNIYIPEYRFNMHPELPVVLNSPIPVEALNNEYNLKLHSIKLPIF